MEHMKHDLTWLDRINCCFNCVTVYTNPCLARQLQIFPIEMGKYENMAESFVYLPMLLAVSYTYPEQEYASFAVVISSAVP